ncbi:unnamed protein product [Mytilus coruscus]|uniref:Ankyrin repeat-containing protein n=1 Tax=Mytilus coruscus TaxID=42192 RepID=A0A6J8BZ16_MYTCO|nr:unnamed protein product [Mytilus coruscus]
MNSIVVAVLQKQYVPDYVCEAFLPVCINNEAILYLACKEAHIYITKLILEHSHNVNIQSALISVCMEKRTTDYVSCRSQDEVEKLKIVKFIVGKYGYEQFDLKVVCQQAYQNRKFKIIEWLFIAGCALHYEFSSSAKVLISACEDGRTDVAKWIHHSFVKTSLDINEEKLFEQACDAMSNYKYGTEKISMVKWVIETFQIKPFNIKLGVLKLLNHNEYQIWKIGDVFFKLVVSMVKKCVNVLTTEDKEEMISKCIKQKHYDIVNWLLENHKCCLVNKQNILNEACKDAQIGTIYLLNEYFHSLDMNEAIIYALSEEDHKTSVCEYLLGKIDHDSLDASRIVSTVCKEHVGDNVMKWFLLKFSEDQNAINKVFIFCCRQGKFNLLKYIFLIVPNEQLDILTAFYEACLQPYEWTQNSREGLCVVNFLFQKLQDKSYHSSDVLNELLATKRYDVILYILEQGYCRIVDKSNLFIKVCRHGHVKLVQWILQNVDHKELDIKAAFHEACTNFEYFEQLQCLHVMWHYKQDINLFEIDTVLKSMTEAPPGKSHVHAYVQDDLRKWLLYIKNINQTNDV